MKPHAGMTITNVTTPDDLAENVARFRVEWESTVHACPPKASGVMPCCERTPFEVPLHDRMTLDASLVTCRPQVWGSEG